MPGVNGIRPVLHADGLVRRLDHVGRDLEVVVDGAPVTFHVGPGCVVTLRGERVKLRMVQPRDRVRVAYTGEPGALVAVTVEVLSGGPGAWQPTPPTHFTPATATSDRRCRRH